MANSQAADIHLSSGASPHQAMPQVSADMLEEKGAVEHTETLPYDSSTYENDAVIEEEPELHWRTYLAVLALFFLNLVQVFALTGPPAIVSFVIVPPDASDLVF